jgi:hypothetical protein
MMKESKPILYADDEVAEAVTTYSEALSLDLPQWLFDYHADVHKNNPDSILMISTYEARALIWLAKLIGAERGASVFCRITLRRLFSFHQ